MSLTVGKDSYVTIEEATQYLSDYHSNDSQLITKWAVLSDTVKESLLRDSTRAIDAAFNYSGRAKSFSQALMFPRMKGMINGGNYPYVSQYFDNSLPYDNCATRFDGLREAKQATVENVAARLLYEQDANDAQHNAILGIKTESIGSASVTYVAASTESRAARGGIYCYDKIRSIMHFWITGSYAAL